MALPQVSRRSHSAPAAAFLFTLIAVAAGSGPRAQTPGAATRVAAPATAVVKPEAVGLSSERLARVTRTMRDYVDQDRLAGIVTLVARRGKIAHLESVGKLDRERGAPMTPDAIFRIASMSKAVTSTAILMLMEDGRLLLSDPVSKYIPAFRQTTVLVPPPPGSPEGAPYGVVPAKRPITIRDLLTHTAGISYGENAAAARYKEAGVSGYYCADKDEPMAALVNRLATLPFDAQPGEKFVYGFNTDILGVVVEQISGVSLDEFFKTRIFAPLKMVDTSFYLPLEKRARLAAVYKAGPDGRIARAADAGTGQGDYVDGPRKCFAGGAGLLSTASDYARFLQMWLNGGELDGVRLLSPKTVELATSNHVGKLYHDGDLGFGLGFEVIEHVGRAGRLASVGEFSWGGAYYTQFWVDPQEQVVAVLMSQLQQPWGDIDLQPKFKNLVYQAIEKPIAWSEVRPAAAGQPGIPSIR
jgi:CubicO group peptidase (beta-lactamase class C family)